MADLVAVDPVKTLDDIFRKTNAKPHIYYLPLTEEEVKAKYGSVRGGDDDGVAEMGQVQEQEKPQVEANAVATTSEDTKALQ